MHPGFPLDSFLQLRAPVSQELDAIFPQTGYEIVRREPFGSSAGPCSNSSTELSVSPDAGLYSSQPHRGDDGMHPLVSARILQGVKHSRS